MVLNLKKYKKTVALEYKSAYHNQLRLYYGEEWIDERKVCVKWSSRAWIQHDSIKNFLTLKSKYLQFEKCVCPDRI